MPEQFETESDRDKYYITKFVEAIEYLIDARVELLDSDEDDEVATERYESTKTDVINELVKIGKEQARI